MTDPKPSLSIDDLLAEATKLVRDKIPDGIAADVHVYEFNGLFTGSLGGAHKSHTFTIDLRIIGGDRIDICCPASETMAYAIAKAHKAIEKFVSDREAARIESERAEFDMNNVPDRFDGVGIA